MELLLTSILQLVLWENQEDRGREEIIASGE